MTGRFLWLLACGLAAIAFVAARPAAAAAPCWRSVLHDWYDGRIGGTYPISCYRAAIAHLPEDVRTYSSAEDDITSALHRRLASRTLQLASSGRRRAAGPVGAALQSVGPSSPTALPVLPLAFGGGALALVAVAATRSLVRRRRRVLGDS